MSKNHLFLFVFILTLSIITACSKQKNPIKGFNAELWREDKNGCSGKRSYLGEIILSNSSKLKGIKDDEITALLGKPEKSNWENRGKKTYYYYLQPGSQCDSSLILEGIKIAIEFNALGKVKMVTEQNF